MTAAEAQRRLLELLVAEAASPHRSESDGQMAEGHSLPDIVAAIKFATSSGALNPQAGSAWGRVKTARVIFPGAVTR